MSAYYSTGRSISDIISDTYEELQDEGAEPVLEEQSYDAARDEEWAESHKEEGQKSQNEQTEQNFDNSNSESSTSNSNKSNKPDSSLGADKSESVSDKRENEQIIEGNGQNELREEEERLEKIEPHQSLNAEERNLFSNCKSVSDAKRLLSSYADRTSKQAQQAFTRLSQQYQKHIYDLENSEEKKSLDTIKENMQAIYGEDFDFKKRLNDLAKWDEYLYSNPVAAIKELAYSKGVKIQIIPNGTTARQIDPRYVELQRENLRLKKAHDAQLEATKRQNQAIVQSDVDAFINAKDENGNLKFPGVRYIENQMAPIIANLKANRPGYLNSQYLEAAYESIAKSDPFIQSLRTNQFNNSTQQVEARKPAKEASSLSQTTSSAVPIEKKPSFKNTMDAIQYSYKQLMKGGL